MPTCGAIPITSHFAGTLRRGSDPIEAFKDHFSPRASLYARYRPHYPGELFEYIASLAPSRRLAWDCATGSGQAAVPLAGLFDKVVATDASESQIRNADPDPRIEYRVATAYATGLGEASVDVVTVAQALHWFDVDRFYSEARRVLAREGVLAIWGYGDPTIDDPVLNEIVRRYNRGTLEEYWHPERDVVLAGYTGIPFPFREVTTPAFTLECQWSLPDLAGYLRTWSATAEYMTRHWRDPVIEVEQALAREWGNPETARLVTWPLSMRAGYAE